MVVQRALRLVAIAIAVVAVIDPATSTDRRVPPVVAVVGGGLAPELERSVRRALGSQFTLVNGAFRGADATLMLGVSASEAATLAAGAKPLIAVLPSKTESAVRITGVHAPTVVQLHASARIDALIDVAGESGDSVVTELRQQGTLLDRKSVATAGMRTVPVGLSYTPRSHGTATLTIRTALVGNDDIADSAHVAVESRDDRLRILFFDTRPSWMSTFVRRALEADGRFDVSSRTATSRNLSTAAGGAPSSLADVAQLATYDAIVVGAPDALSSAAAAGVEAYLRQRGGAVVLLFDTPVTGNARALIGDVTWRSSQSDAGRAVVMDGVPAPLIRPAANSTRDSTNPPSMRVSEAALPMTMPIASVALGTIAGESNASVLFEVPLGAGRLIVSTAFDAWRFRDPAESRFDEVWPQMIATAAASSLPALDLALTPSLAIPGQRVELTLTARDVALAPLEMRSRQTRVSAVVSVGGERRMIRLYPAYSPGTFRGSFMAPHDGGSYRIVASAERDGTLASDSAMLVVGAFSFATPALPNLLRSLAHSSGGAVIESSRLVDLAGVIDDVAPGSSQRVSWHPMRSAWWLLPFALLLGAEWWLRRRRGQS